MKAIICVAGEGKRLRPLTEDRPKCLIKVGKKTILEYILDNISDCGIRDVVLIVGYKSEKIKSIIGTKYCNCRIKYYVNDIYYKTDNMYSLWMAKNEIEQGIIFFNGDVITHPDILRKLLDSPCHNAVSIDKNISLLEDSMKVKIINGKIKSISKDIRDGDGWAIGIYKLSPEGSKDYYEVVKKLIRIGSSNASFVKPIELISKFTDVYAIDTDCLPWIEIDDFKDLKKAKSRIIEFN